MGSLRPERRRRLDPLAGRAPLPVRGAVRGLFVDAHGNLSDSPFLGSSPEFGGAVGVQVVSGPAGSALPYSVSTAGVILNGGKVVLIDVFGGAQALLPAPTS